MPGVIVCFSAGNLTVAATKCRAKWLTRNSGSDFTGKFVARRIITDEGGVATTAVVSVGVPLY